MLTVPAPAIDYRHAEPPPASGVALIEFQVTVDLGAVHSTLGKALAPADLRLSGLHTLRRQSASSPLEVWDQKSSQWISDAGVGLDPRTAMPLAYHQERPTLPWQGILVGAGAGAGAKDAIGKPKFNTSPGPFPSYRFRGFFVSRSGETGVGPPSAGVRFRSVIDQSLITLGPGLNQDLPHATEAHFELCDVPKNSIGGLVILRDFPGARVTLSNASGASIVINPDGAIELRPAMGKNVVVKGDLEAENVRCFFNGTRKWL